MVPSTNRASLWQTVQINLIYWMGRVRENLIWVASPCGPGESCRPGTASASDCHHVWCCPIYVLNHSHMQLWRQVLFRTGLENSSSGTRMYSVSDACEVVLGMGDTNFMEGVWRHRAGVLKLGSSECGGFMTCRSRAPELTASPHKENFHDIWKP